MKPGSGLLKRLKCTIKGGWAVWQLRKILCVKLVEALICRRRFLPCQPMPGGSPDIKLLWREKFRSSQQNFLQRTLWVPGKCAGG
jgi:hypothetical protein